MGGDGAEPCLASDPCSIEDAINSASGASMDDVTLLGGLPPAPYVTETPLSVPINVSVHGEVGARPMIQSSAIDEAGVELHSGSVMRDVVVEYSGTNKPAVQLTGGGMLERVTGHATSGASSTSGAAERWTAVRR